uniref:Tpd52 like 2a n=1 Tax=Cyprinus carpio TaxID=7962 RepID=A0A8C1TLF7_CYPCA
MSYWDSSPKNSSDVIVYSPLLCFKVDDEIQTLRQVLVAKERHAAELKRRLGISPISEIKQNLTHTYIHTYIYQINISTCSNAYMRTSQTLGDLNRRVTTSNKSFSLSLLCSYKRTQETLSQAGQMTSAAFSSMGSAIRNQFGEMRNSPSFKTFEDKVENMKYKVMGQSNEESDRSHTSNNAPF